MHVITRLEFGGAQTSTLFTVENLSRKGYEVYLLTSPGYLSRMAEKIPGVNLYYLPFRREINPWWDVMVLFLLVKKLSSIRPHILHTHSSKAGILGRWGGFITRVPLIYHTIHGFPFHDFQPLIIKKFYAFLERITSLVTTRLIAITREDIKKGLREGIGGREKYILIRDGIDFSRFQRNRGDKEEIKKDLGIREKWIVGTVSCFKPQKNLGDFIRMAALLDLPDTGFVMVGDGRERRKMEREICRRGMEERFYLMGWREDVERILRIFDVFVLTSLWEGLPKAVLEALTSRIPVVANAVDGVREVVRDGYNGYLIRPGDVYGMAKRVREIILNPSLRKRMGENAGRSLGEEFDIRNMVEELERVYMEDVKRIK